MSDTRQFPSVPPKLLKVDILSTDAVFKLRDIVWYTDATGTDINLAAADFGTVGYGVFEPRTVRQEFFTWDPSTLANYATTGVTITARGLPWSNDYTTASASRKFNHGSGSKVLLFTNAPAFYTNFANKGNDETITGLWQFPNGANTPQIGASYVAPTLDNQVATKKYADDLAIAGSPDATTSVKGIVEIATGAELAAGTGTGSTGATVVAAGSSFKNTSAGAGDANKVPVLDAAGVLDNTFMPTILTRTADSLQISTDPDSNDDAVRKLYVDTTLDARITQADADTLTNGATSNASALHFHIPQTFATMSTPGGWYQPSTNRSSKANQTVVSSQDGSEMYFTSRRNVNAASNNVVFAQRYLLNTSTGCFIPTDSAQLSINDTVTAAGVSMAVGSTYCWFLCCSSGSANVVITRTTRALGSPQVMTISGSALAAAYAMCGDDNTLYVFTGANPVVVTPYTISGTTATRGTSFNISANSAISSPYFDGTDIIGMFNQLYQIRRYNLSGTIQGSSVTYGANTARYNDAGIAAKYGNTSQIYLTTFDLTCSDVTDGTGSGSFIYNTISLPKP